MNDNEITVEKIDSLITLYSNGKAQKAVDEINKLLENYKDNPLLFNIQGACYTALGQTINAIKSYESAIELKPDYADSHYNLGNSLRSIDRLEDSVKSFEKAISYLPDFLEAIFNLGVSLMALGQMNDAIEPFEHVLLIDPNNIDSRINLGSIYQKKNNYGDAIEQYEAILIIDSVNQDALNNLGIIYQELGQYEDAISFYEQAQKSNPKFSGSHYNLGMMYQDLGLTDQAIEQFELAISIDDNSWSHHSLSYLKNYKLNDPQIDKIKFLLLKPGLSLSNQSYLNLALARIYDKLGMHEDFFEFLNKGNSLRKKELGYSLKKSIEIHSATKKIFESSFPSIKKNKSFSPPQKRPIFIVGMPRSGTTLVEQIISSHSKVYGAGELNKISELAKPILKNFSNDGLINLNERALLFIRDEYENMLSSFNSIEKIITDKLPLNFQYIGFILAAFPEAKIVHIKRDARATCWSNYKYFFSSEENGFAHDFSDLTGFYKSYVNLMDYWNKLFPNQIHNMSYEELTENQEKETRSLLEYCELEWDESCINFEKNTRSVQTISSLQVRKKMYQGSSDAWKKYWSHIQPLISALEKY
ncbi:sulfotransferase [Candidatus Pseudothioglobus singularis]|nr:sulfotransferase [Candidatus Pseudothioglobus singularis]